MIDIVDFLFGILNFNNVEAEVSERYPAFPMDDKTACTKSDIMTNDCLYSWKINKLSEIIENRKIKAPLSEAIQNINPTAPSEPRSP